MFNFYSKLKEKYKVEFRERANINTFAEMLTAQYDITVERSEINPKYFLQNLFLEGYLGVIEYKNNLVFGRCTFSNITPDEPIGSDVTVVVEGVGSFNFVDWKNNKNVAIVKLNELYEPDVNIYHFASMISDIDTSMQLNIVNTRLINIFKAKDTKAKKKIETCIEKALNGEPAVIVDDLMISDEVGDAFGLMELNKSDKISNIQYLSVTRSYIMNTFFSLYAMYAVGGEKIAQQSVAEINQGTNASWILCKSRLDCIKKCFDILNEKFGVNWSIELSECWQLEDKVDHNTAEDKSEELEEIEETNESEVNDDESEREE